MRKKTNKDRKTVTADFDTWITAARKKSVERKRPGTRLEFKSDSNVKEESFPLRVLRPDTVRIKRYTGLLLLPIADLILLL